MSQGLGIDHELPHYDVIIYDKLNSPILWIGSNLDSSDQGQSMGILAQYVKCVIEVKSTFKPATVKEAFEHLNELSSALNGDDCSDERYKRFLPKDFICYVLFFEVLQNNKKSKSGLNTIASEGYKLRGFSGVVILKAEGHEKENTGIINLINSATNICNIKFDETENLIDSFPDSDFINLAPETFIGSSLTWSESNFSIFAFNLLAQLDGTYKPGYVSSLFMGRTI